MTTRPDEYDLPSDTFTAKRVGYWWHIYCRVCGMGWTVHTSNPRQGEYSALNYHRRSHFNEPPPLNGQKPTLFHVLTPPAANAPARKTRREAGSSRRKR